MYNGASQRGVQLERRDWLKTAVLGTGAAAAGPLVTQIAPAAAAGAGTGGEWSPLLFDEHQNATVIALAELIIPETDTPGAKAAKVNQYIDLMLHDVDPDKGHAFLKGLGWLDGYAIRLHDAPFVALDAADQTAILESLDAAGGSSQSDQASIFETVIDAEPTASDTDSADLAVGAAFFKRVKRLTIEGYYTSRIGIAELNKNGVPSTFACEHGTHA